MRSITICFNLGNTEMCNNDFAKLRLYIRPNEIQIACYAPNILKDDSLAENSTLFASCSQCFKECWEDVIKCIVDEPATTDNSLLFTVSEITYSMAKSRSKVVWANYLSSFANVVVVKNKLSSLLSRFCSTPEMSIEWNIDKQDLCYLLGPDLAEEIQHKLYRIFESEYTTGFNNTYNTYNTATYLVPSMLRDEYLKTVESHINYSNTVREALSLIFTNMHYNIGLFGNREHDVNIPRVLRYDFGETYESLFEKLSPKFYSMGDDKLRIEIHKWIDEKIDLGITVPKYESSLNENGDSIWRRYFRAGENEDCYMKLARVAIKCINEFLIQNGTSSLTIEAFTDKIYKQIKKYDNKYPGLFKLNELEQSARNHWDKASDNDEGAAKMLWVFLTNIPVITPSSINSDGTYEICNNKITQSLSKGIPVEPIEM